MNVIYKSALYMHGLIFLQGKIGRNYFRQFPFILFEHLKVSDISAAGLPVFLGIPLQVSIS